MPPFWLPYDTRITEKPSDYQTYNVLGIIAEKLGCGFKIFPSSVHELLVLPDSEDIASEDDRMTAGDIAEINRTIVDVEERLSNSIYHYDKETGEVSIFEQGEPL